MSEESDQEIGHFFVSINMVAKNDSFYSGQAKAEKYKQVFIKNFVANVMVIRYNEIKARVL